MPFLLAGTAFLIFGGNTFKLFSLKDEFQLQDAQEHSSQSRLF
jgi:hypothetical protein